MNIINVKLNSTNSTNLKTGCMNCNFINYDQLSTIQMTSCPDCGCETLIWYNKKGKIFSRA